MVSSEPHNNPYQSPQTRSDQSVMSQHGRIVASGLLAEVVTMLGVFMGIPVSIIAWAAAGCVTTWFGCRLGFESLQRTMAMMPATVLIVSAMGLIIATVLFLSTGLSETAFRIVVYGRVAGMVAALAVISASRRHPDGDSSRPTESPANEN